ncbi:MAG: patatin-like phospholipase family protein [Culicoidibacterales bacterium]
MDIVSFNGGGAKGKRVTSFLNAQNKNIHVADMYAGTSTGSIIAAMLALGFTPAEINKKYDLLGSQVFHKEMLRFGILKEKYDNSNLIQLARETYGDVRFGDLKKDLFIPVLNITCEKVDFIRTTTEKYKKVLVSDAVIASSSAPSFFAPYSFGGCVYVDGGMAVNNPSFASFTEAKKKTGSINHKMISLTTGSDIDADYDAMRKWTIADAPHLINVILSEQERSSDHYCKHWIKDYQRIEMNATLSSGNIDDFSKKNTLLMEKEGILTVKELK